MTMVFPNKIQTQERRVKILGIHQFGKSDVKVMEIYLMETRPTTIDVTNEAKMATTWVAE